MARKRMWMGTRGYETWVPAPAINLDRSRIGHTSELALVNGGIALQRSKASHGEWKMHWQNLSTEDAAMLEGLAAGLFDTPENQGLIHFIDPMAAFSNVLPPHWATPGLDDSVPIMLTQPRTIVTEPASDYRYPARSAKFSVSNSTSSRKHYVPIPPGHRLVIGAHGSGTNVGSIRVTPFIGATAQPYTNLPWMGRNSAQLTNRSFGGGGITGVEISLVANAGGSAVINAIIARILPGVPSAVQTGNFVPGRGASGCAFVTAPTESALSAGLDLTTLSARLVEVEPWL